MKKSLLSNQMGSLNSQFNRLVILVCVVVFLILSIGKVLASGEGEGFSLEQFIGGETEEEENSLHEEREVSRPIVSIDNFEVGSLPATISIFGVVEPQYQQKVSVEVDGRITSLSEKLNVGMFLKKGEEIAKIEDASYRAQVASAEQAVAASELSLLH